MFATKFIILLVGCLACAEKPYMPGRLRPSPERMQELLNAPVPQAKPRNLPFELQVNPRMAFVGSDVWVTCVVPERFGIGRIRWGIEGVQVSETALDHTQNRLLVQNLPCGVLHASCAISTAKGVQRAADVEIVVSGGVCDGL